MKFSVLLPTRDRLDLLRYAVESVRRQEGVDWEIIISDNQSSGRVQEYVESLEDHRIRWNRTDRPLPVTDNWNAALALSSGDYVVMLGDDDGLLPGYFQAMSEVLQSFSNPEAVYCEALQFAYPNVIPGHSGAFVQTAYSEIIQGERVPFLSSRSKRTQAIRRSMGLHLSFSYNMQHWLLNRRLIDRLTKFGPLFQSPFPDYFASNLVMLEAEEVVVVPQPCVVIGISPKSFGFYYFNDRADEGSEQLASFAAPFVPEAARSAILPGNALLTGWYLAMAWLEDRVGRKYSLTADTDRYRYLQVAQLVQREGLAALRKYWSSLSIGERLRFGARLVGLHVVSRVLPSGASRRFGAAWHRHESPWPAYHPEIRTVGSRTLLELVEASSPIALDAIRTPAR